MARVAREREEERVRRREEAEEEERMKAKEADEMKVKEKMKTPEEMKANGGQGGEEWKGFGDEKMAQQGMHEVEEN